MGHMKGFRVVVNCCCRDILRFVFDSFFFLVPFTCYLLFVCRSCKGIKEKDKDIFKHKFYFGGLRPFCGDECFPKQAETIVFPRSRRFEEYHGITLDKLQVWDSVMCLRVQRVRSAEAASSRKHNALQNSGLSMHMRSLLAAKRKRCVRPSRYGKGFWERVFLWHQEAFLFKHAPISLPARGLPGNCYFYICPRYCPFSLLIQSPQIHPTQKTSFALKKRLKVELETMTKISVIEPVNEPTEWVNSLLTVEKPNGSLHIYLDQRYLNKAKKWEYFQIPTAEGTFADMHRAKYISKIDASNGFW